MNLHFAYDFKTLAAVLGCTPRQLGYYLHKRPLSAQYKEFEITKKTGGTRTINAPASNLKLIQRNIARSLEQLTIFKPAVNGFVAGRDIKRNAAAHLGQRHILNIDLEDFFGSINFGRVYGLLSKPPYKLASNVAAAIAKAATYNNKLPQGAPCSPIITNLICAKMDAELTRFATANKCIYTRYADDITFSSNRKIMPIAAVAPGKDGAIKCEIVPALRTIIQNNGFIINEKKVRLASRTARQEVTGLVINKRVNVRRRFVREIRAMLHAWKKFGLEAATKTCLEKYRKKNFESVVRGKIEFVGQIRGRHDDVFRKLADEFNALATHSKIRTALNPKEILAQAVWVVEHDGAQQDHAQGTAFFLEGFGIVTCAHCLGDGLYLYHPSNHSKTYNVIAKHVDAHRDLAVLDVPKDLSHVIPLKLRKIGNVTTGSPVNLAGYPNHAHAKPLRVEPGTLINRFPKSGVSYLEISPKIISGNSGGPLLDSNYEVIVTCH